MARKSENLPIPDLFRVARPVDQAYLKIVYIGPKITNAEPLYDRLPPPFGFHHTSGNKARINV